MGFSDRIAKYKSANQPSLDSVLEEVSMQRRQKCGDKVPENLIPLEIAEAAYVRTVMLNVIGLPDSQQHQLDSKAAYEAKLADHLAVERGGDACEYLAQARLLVKQAQSITLSCMPRSAD